MKKTLTLTLALGLLLFSVLAGDFVSDTSADAYIPPEMPPSGYRIQSNGDSDIPGVEGQGTIYTLTCDVNGTIVIEQDGIVLNGNGHTIKGNGNSSGIWLQDRINVTIKNANILGFDQGIRFSHYAPDRHTKQTNPNYTIACKIEHCNITGNVYGISFFLARNCSALGNCVTNNTYGVYLYGSDNIFKKNQLGQNTYNFWEANEYANDVDSSNTINDKPIYYWINRRNQTVPSDAGTVILKNCSGIKAYNLNLSNNGNGISLYYTNNSELVGNDLTHNYWRGIAVWWSHNNSIIGNRITNTPYDGIEIYDSENNTISHNLIANNENGIYHRTPGKYEVISDNIIINNTHAGVLGGTDYSAITTNFVADNGGGLTVGSGSQIIGNNITGNGATGLIFGSNNLIVENYISKNQIGMVTKEGQGNRITENSITENSDWGIRFQGPAKNNLIYYNNFMYNNGSQVQASVKGSWVFSDLGKIFDEDHPPPQHVAGPSNAWDNGTVGNYWSDYRIRYPDAQAIENRTISSRPYFIDDNNQDHHPLLEPIEFTVLEMPSIDVPQDMYVAPLDEDQTLAEMFTSSLITVIVLVILVAVGLVIGILIYIKKKRAKLC
jgi:parallel beta-helix repeat protein